MNDNNNNSFLSERKTIWTVKSNKNEKSHHVKKKLSPRDIGIIDDNNNSNWKM